MAKHTKEDFTVRCRIWIDKEGKPFLGWGRVRLLQEIEQCGSITRAAKELNMSYRQAWEHIRNMNDIAGEPIVIASTGGKNGGGTLVTDYGKAMVRKFIEIEQKIQQYGSGYSI